MVGALYELMKRKRQRQSGKDRERGREGDLMQPNEHGGAKRTVGKGSNVVLAVVVR